MTKTGYLPRFRFPIYVIRIAVLLHLFMRSRDVPVVLSFLFRIRVTHKTVCEWSNKFRGQINLPFPVYSSTEHLIAHVDEKYVMINGTWHYWWTLKDMLGNVLGWLISKSRDSVSAKKLFKESRRHLNRNVELVVRDGLPAYDKTVKYLGRKCKDVIAGIKGKPIIFKNKFYWLTNNPAESFNSEIDSYLARFQYHFSSIKSAQKYADNFMLTRHLKRLFAQKKFSEASSMLKQALVL